MRIDADVRDGLAESFRRFAAFEAAGLSSLYEQLALAVADAPDLLDLAALARREQRRPTLFFAAIQHVVLRHGTCYPPSIEELRAFCADHQDEVSEVIRTRHTQTNEIARCGQFPPALGLTAERTEKALGLVELGASAGLNLLLDRFHCRYAGDAGKAAVGDEDAPVQVACKVRGQMPPVPDAIPAIASRIGIDLAPVDVTVEDEARWLRACVWPDHDERAQRLAAALALARDHPPEVLAGDAAERLEEACARIPEDEALVVFHSSVLPYFSDDDHRRLRTAIRRVAAMRDLHWLFAEAPGLVDDVLDVGSVPAKPTRFGVLGLIHLGPRAEQGEVLALTGPHGRWLEWLAEVPPSRRSSPIEIRPYDPSWPATFRRVAGPIETALSGIVLAVEHVGSTAVPGLAAKPIIDIDVVVPRDRMSEAISRLSTLGYEHEGDLRISDRKAFVSPPETPTHHLYLCPEGSREFVRHLTFRDYLRGHPDDAKAYAAVKRSAAADARSDRVGYTMGKTEFVEAILARADLEPASQKTP